MKYIIIAIEFIHCISRSPIFLLNSKSETIRNDESLGSSAHNLTFIHREIFGKFPNKREEKKNSIEWHPHRWVAWFHRAVELWLDVSIQYTISIPHNMNNILLNHIKCRLGYKTKKWWIFYIRIASRVLFPMRAKFFFTLKSTIILS